VETESGYIKKINNKRIGRLMLIMAPTRRRPNQFEIFYVIEFENPFYFKGLEIGREEVVK